MRSKVGHSSHRISVGLIAKWDDTQVGDLQLRSVSAAYSPMLTLFCGLPGSGKTTLARRLEADGQGVRLCTDHWQAELGVDHGDTDFHGRLQPLLYRHGLTLLRHGVDVILEDGLWMAEERAEKFRDARACGSRIELHVFDVPYDELRRAWDLFQLPSPEELASVDHYEFHGPGA